VTQYRIKTQSGASPVEAGLGIVHAHSIVATTTDELTVCPSPASFELAVGSRKCAGEIADLDLEPGTYDCIARFGTADGPPIEKKMRLYLIDPSRICRRFGARYGSLEYDLPVVTGPGKTQPWNSLWKTNEVADIVVDFEQPYKFVLWRGMSFAPSWALDNVITSNFFAETVEPGVFRDCCEMMSDRECRYIHARVIHSSPARVVIHWRHPLSDSAYNIWRNQWVDELYYIYPDGVAARNVTIHLDPNDEAVWQTCPQTGRQVPYSMMSGAPGKRTFNDMEFITVNPPGATSDDVTPLEAFTMLDGNDFACTYRWPTPTDFGKEPLPKLDEYIFRMNYLGRPGVFIATPPAGLQMRLQPNAPGMRYEAGERVEDDRWASLPDVPANFHDCIHWPITRGHGTSIIADVAQYHDRPTHTFLGFANNAPVDVQPNGAVTWTWLSGMAPDDDTELRAKVKAWIAPPPLQGACYDHQQRAYIVAAPSDSAELSVSPAQRLVSPTLILRGCDAASARVEIDGEALDPADVAAGPERRLDSVQTVVTLRHAPIGCRSIRIQMVD